MADTPVNKPNRGVPVTQVKRDATSNKGVAVPTPKNDLNVLTRWAQAITELVDTGERRTNNVDDSNVKVKDLKDVDFLRNNTSFGQAGYLTQNDLDDAFSADSELWNNKLKELIDYLNNYDPEARIKGSMTYRLRKATQVMQSQFKSVAERIEETRDSASNELQAATASIVKASTEYAGGVCLLNDNYYTPSEFYLLHRGLDQEAVDKAASEGFSGFKNACLNDGGLFKEMGAITRTLDEQVSKFKDLVTGDMSSATYSNFIETLATDSEAWTKFKQTLEAAQNYVCTLEDGTIISSATTQLECDAVGGIWAPADDGAMQAWFDRNDVVRTGKACYDAEGNLISASTKAQCDIVGGYWIDSATAGSMKELKSNIDDNIGSELTQYQETVANEFESVATDITKLRSDYNDNSAAIEQVAETVSDAKGSIAVLSDKLTANDNSISQKLSVSRDGAYYALESDIKGKLGGIRFTSDSQSADVVVDANSFKVGDGTFSGSKPVFQVVGDVIKMQNVEIEGYLKAQGLSKTTQLPKKDGLSMPYNRNGSGYKNTYLLGYAYAPYGSSKWGVQVSVSAVNTTLTGDSRDFDMTLNIDGDTVCLVVNSSQYNIGNTAIGGKGGITRSSVPISITIWGYNSQGTVNNVYTTITTFVEET